MRSLILLALPLILVACDRKPAEKHSTMPMAPAASADKAKDPICGMMVDKATSTKTTHEGATYYFCADACLKKFQADPKKYQAHCACVKTAKKCDCGHCAPKGETCDCN